MLDDAFQRLPTEIEAAEQRITIFQLRQNTEGLVVMVKAAIGLHGAVQRLFTGMAEAGVPQIVRQRHGFR